MAYDIARHRDVAVDHACDRSAPVGLPRVRGASHAESGGPLRESTACRHESGGPQRGATACRAKRGRPPRAALADARMTDIINRGTPKFDPATRTRPRY